MEIVINHTDPTPPFEQLIDQVKKAFLSGELISGSAMPSIRQLANDLGLDHSEVAKAYRQLELDAVIQTNAYRTIIHPDELRRAERALMEEMERELQDARDMQMELLPRRPPSMDGVDVSGVCIPAKHVGGDYYDYIALDEDNRKLGIVMADVSGHGMRSATVAMRFSDILQYEVRGREDASEILAGLDESLKRKTRPEMFVTCGIGVLDLSSERSFVFTSAGNPEVYHFQQETGEVQPLGQKGIPLATPFDLSGLKAFGSTTRALVPGDVVVFVSDGIEEAQRGDEFYGENRLMSVIGKHGRKNASAEGLRDAIVTDVRNFLGNVAQQDDLTVVILRIE